MAILREVVVNGETIVPLPNGDFTVHSSKPNQWYYVTHVGICGCKGFQHKGKCRHSKAALTYVDLEMRRDHQEVVEMEAMLNSAKHELLTTLLELEL